MSASTSTFDDLCNESGLVAMAAFIKQGYQSARLTGRYLQDHRIGQLDGTYPGWFLIDLGYALQIREWERQGLLSQLPIALPSSKSVIQSLIEKLRNAAQSKHNCPKPNAELAKKVTQAFLVFFNHTSYSELNGDFVVRLSNSSDVIQALIQWAWRNRNT